MAAPDTAPRLLTIQFLLCTISLSNKFEACLIQLISLFIHRNLYQLFCVILQIIFSHNVQFILVMLHGRDAWSCITVLFS